MNTILLYTDGACRGNPGRGGWGFTIIRDIDGIEHTYQNCGRAAFTTNQQMELEACAQGLQFITSVFDNDLEVDIYTDSAYLSNCFRDKWYIKWMSNGWKNAKGEPVKNQSSWERILGLLHSENIKRYNFHKVAGHSGDKWNEETDKLAKSAIDNNL